MKDIKKVCSCGREDVDTMSCVAIEDNVVEITYVCKGCGYTKSEKHYLYREG